MALQNLRSSTANKRPVATSLSDGQIALNINAASPGIFFKNSSNVLTKVGPIHIGTSAPNSSPAGSSGNAVGEQWMDTSGSAVVMKVWDGSAWQEQNKFGAVAGTAAAPSIYFAGDTDTGIYSPGANQVAISTGGSGRLFVDSSGRLGLGTSSPGSELEIAGGSTTAGPGAELRLTSKDQTIGVADEIIGSITFKNSDASAGMAGVMAKIDAASNRVYDGDNASGMNLRFFAGDKGDGVGTPPERMRITTEGRVGIGTTAVSNLLHLRSNSSSNVDHLYIQNRNGGANSGARIAFSNGTVDYGDNRYAYIGAINTGASESGNHLVFATNVDGAAVSERLRITSDGNVGVGTSSPANYANFVTIALADTSGAEVDFIKGSTVQGAVYNAGDVFYIESKSTVPTAFVTNGSERARIDSSGRVGIGTTSPAESFTVGTGNAQITSGQLTVGVTGTSGLQFINNGVFGTLDSNPLILRTASDEKARFDSSGRLLVGTSTAPTATTVTDSRLVVEGNVGGNPTGGAILTLARGSAITGTGQFAGEILFADTGAGYFGRIAAEGDGTPGTGSYPGRLVFSTTAAGASSPTERMRIKANGDVAIKTESLILENVNGRIYLNQATASSFGVASGGSSTATVYIGNAAIQVSSDARLKENIEDTNLDALDVINQIKVKDFTWNDPTDTSPNNRNARGTWTGLIAQELVEVLPFVVNAPRNEDDGSIDHDSEDIWTLDQSQLCPVLIKAMQQQQEIIASLEARLSALEAQ